MSSSAANPSAPDPHTSSNMNSLLRENRVFPPPTAFAARAHVGSREQYDAMYRRSVEDPDGFWREAAAGLDWSTPFTSVVEGEMGSATWFNGGKLNLAHNCVDRHATGPRADKVALLWEGEPGEVRRVTFSELHDQVQRFANVLLSLGVSKGDRVAVYMGMCPELAIALLACARIGAVHSVIFGGFAAQAIVDRVNDSQCVALLTQDVSYRRGAEVKLKAIVDEALPKCPSIQHVVVYQRGSVEGAPATRTPVPMVAGRDVYWHEAMAAAAPTCPCEPMDAEDPLYILYTSGTTGKPKGLVHTTGGYAVGAYLTSKYVFDLQDDDVYWCTADIGWVTGHSYVALRSALRTARRRCSTKARRTSRKTTASGSSSTTTRSPSSTPRPPPSAPSSKWGDQCVHKHSLASLRLLGTVGEPINPEAWMWYHRQIGERALPHRRHLVADRDGRAS